MFEREDHPVKQGGDREVTTLERQEFHGGVEGKLAVRAGVGVGGFLTGGGDEITGLVGEPSRHDFHAAAVKSDGEEGGWVGLVVAGGW